MTRSLGAGITTGIALASDERCQFIYMDWADTDNDSTPVYLTTAAVDVSWNSHTWESVGGLMDLDALGESADDPSKGQRIKLSGVNQVFIALILGARCRGRQATIWHVGIDRTLGTVKADPVKMFSGLMNGGFQIHESRSYQGGSCEVTCDLTSRLDELVKVRGVRTNEASHRAAIAGASADTGFQNVANLVNRKVFWGQKTPSTIPAHRDQPNPNGPLTNQPGLPSPTGSGPPTPSNPMGTGGTNSNPWPGVT